MTVKAVELGGRKMPLNRGSNNDRLKEVNARAALDARAAKIEANHQAGEDATLKGIEHYRDCGRELIAARADCERLGVGWLDWLAKHVKKPKRARAYHYITLAEEWDDLVTRNADIVAEWRRISGNRTKAKGGAKEEAEVTGDPDPGSSTATPTDEDDAETQTDEQQEATTTQDDDEQEAAAGEQTTTTKTPPTRAESPPPKRPNPDLKLVIPPDDEEEESGEETTTSEAPITDPLPPPKEWRLVFNDPTQYGKAKRWADYLKDRCDPKDDAVAVYKALERWFKEEYPDA